jgi:raffinose/stachyose/melibiose transport system substrate-binding protein
MMKRVKLLPFLSLLLLMVISVLGCSQSNESATDPVEGSEASEEVTIDFAIHVANPEDQEPAFYQTVEKFMEQNPDITINLQGTDQQEHIRNIKMKSQSNALPDIFWMLPASAQELEEAGQLLDLTPFFDNNPKLVEKFHMNMFETYQIDGKQYGMPYQPLVTGFWYNEALFDQYNVDLPETYEDLTEAVKVFKENDVVSIAKGARDPYSIWAFLTMFSRYGYFDKIDDILAGEESFHNDDFLKFYEKIDELRELGAFPANITTQSYFQAVETFMTGEAALLDAGVWETKKIEESELANDVGFWWGPTFDDGVGNQNLSSIVPAAPLVVGKHVEDDQAKYEAVMKFLQFYYSEDGAQIMLDNQVPPMIVFNGQIDEEKHPVFSKVVEQMNRTDWESQPNQPDLVISESIANALYDSIYGVMNGIYSPEEALDVVENRISGQ